MRKIVVLLSVLFAMMIASPAYAVPWSSNNSADDEGAIHQVVINDVTTYDTPLRDAMAEWNYIDYTYRDNGEGVRFILDEQTDNKVELRVEDYYDPNTGAWGQMIFRAEPETDVVRFNSYHMSGASGFSKQALALHELGHSIGGVHHECTPQNQDDTVMVGNCPLIRQIPQGHDWEDWWDRWIVPFQ